MTKPISADRLAANRANAAKSTGPRTPEGKSRSSQNARKHSFIAANFAVVRLEDLEAVANIRADLIDVYQPINSEELQAIERLALARQALNRSSLMEIGMYTAFLNEALDPDGRPLRLLNGDLIEDIEVTQSQNRSFILFEGLSRLNRQSKDILVVLRIQAQTERLHRRAIEEVERTRRLRKELQSEPISHLEPEETKPIESPKTNPPEPPAAVVPNIPTPQRVPVDPIIAPAAALPRRPAARRHPNRPKKPTS
jgi:hypothetical protein